MEKNSLLDIKEYYNNFETKIILTVTYGLIPYDNASNIMEISNYTWLI